jgi:signal transduction histidine kinase
MTPEKLLKLNDTYQKYIELGLFDFPVDASQEFVIENIMGYGTNLDEKIFSFSELRELVLRQRQQAAGIEMRVDRTPVFKKITSDENAAIFVEEVKITMLVSGMEHKLDIRLTTALEYMDENWMVIHWHASVPVVTNEVSDTWNVGELNRKNEELQKLVDERTKELRISLEELKAAQAQLIQSEKMASLGELTAGIAHEIQNPLNFVNNFSEVNTELIDELRQEVEKGNLSEVKLIAKDIKDNEQKINHHGKRADAIVKGMLQHSRSSSGQKEPTDINKLADEYLRLAYHGLRAKDNFFNAILKTDYDESIGNISIIPQDIGRVMLNLITNAFYVVNEKKAQQSAEKADYEPTVTVSTKKVGDKVLISVKDNGNGIPQKVLDKIFQPFFTTKPTGQGTGLGLSLSYDIVKAHGGELKVKTREGEGSEFIIQIPIK